MPDILILGFVPYAFLLPWILGRWALPYSQKRESLDFLADVASASGADFNYARGVCR